jgi:hypothetical protein
MDRRHPLLQRPSRQRSALRRATDLRRPRWAETSCVHSAWRAAAAGWWLYEAPGVGPSHCGLTSPTWRPHPACWKQYP